MDNPPLIYAAMTKVMASVGAVAKSRRNTQQQYSFRGIDDLYAALQRPLVEAGVFVATQVLEREVTERQTKSGGALIYTTLKVRHVFYAGDGSSIEVVTVGEAMDSGDKSSNKAMSAALKYALIQTFCIPTEESGADTEEETHEVQSQPRREAPKDVEHKPEVPLERKKVAGATLKALSGERFAFALWNAYAITDEQQAIDQIEAAANACNHAVKVLGMDKARKLIASIVEAKDSLADPKKGLASLLKMAEGEVMS